MCSWKWAAVLSCKKKQHTGGGFFWLFQFGLGVFVQVFQGFLKLQEERLNVIKTSTVMYQKLFSSYQDNYFVELLIPSTLFPSSRCSMVLFLWCCVKKDFRPLKIQLTNKTVVFLNKMQHSIHRNIFVHKQVLQNMLVML